MWSGRDQALKVTPSLMVTTDHISKSGICQSTGRQSAGRAIHLAAPGSWSQTTALREHGKATGAVHRPRASASKYRLHVLVASASSLTATAALSRLTAGTTQTVAANATPTATTRAGGPRTKTRSMASAVMATCVYQGLKQSTPYARKCLWRCLLHCPRLWALPSRMDMGLGTEADATRL